jgi:lipid-binding SYLF domain-containing protein
MSILARLKQDGTNAFNDAYSSFVLGDDAGKSARIALVLQPQKSQFLQLGMTFLEINGRAYVRTVEPNSEAGLAGIMPRDAVQFASVYKLEWSNNGESAKTYALDCDAKGMRISYDELRHMLREGLDPQYSSFLSPESRWKGPPIPSSINVCVPTVEDEARPLSPFSSDRPKPVVFVFRRTRQRPNTLWNFRLDDECDFASSLIRRLAPTADMDMPSPDTWEELVHDGTDWLLGNGSILPPKNGSGNQQSQAQQENTDIPYDDYERTRAAKLAHLRSRMAAETLQSDRAEDMEAATIRGMIQKAVGLAFVRASKIVLGVSVHGGSGVVIARLPDGTWSAPSAIGTWGIGLGVQFGLEVAEYIFILQTQESLDHFRRGSSFTVGGNIGAAVAGMGREAYGAASVRNSCSTEQRTYYQEDEYNDDDSDQRNRQSGFGVAPIVAYAKSQGLYIGVSLEGSRIFTRDDINARAYKFGAGREVSANDILSGKVGTPPEAEDLYASLHSVEFTHEMSCLPRPPEVLRKDSLHSWYYDRSTLTDHSGSSESNPFSFLPDLSKDEAADCDSFETHFKKFMYGGVSVQRLVPNSESQSGKTGKERRTLWLMLPEVGALRLGFVSKLSDGDGALVSNKSSTQQAQRDQPTDMSIGDLGTVASGEGTLDSGLAEKESSLGGHIRSGNVQLSNKHSVALTDVTLLSQEPHTPVRFNPDDQTEHLRVISIQDVSGTSLLFLANNFREAELLVCGLKLLLEQETARLSVRGGLPISALGGNAGLGSMSPTAARGFKESSNLAFNNPRKKKNRQSSGYSSSEMEEDDIPPESSLLLNPRHMVPEGRMSWGEVPGRDYMRGQAAQSAPHDELSRSANGQQGVTKYVHGQLLVRDIATNIQLPLPLPLCRVLLLDSTSPVVTKWEQDRGDANFTKTDWTFPPATPRDLERHDSEHQLIASGSMMGAHRTTNFDRPRNGTMVRLSETQIIDADDSEKLAFTVSERNPRRGFSIKVRILLRSSKENACEATVLGEVRPVGKNMTNQAAVHKAFLLVLNEINDRYGIEGGGLMSGFLSVVNSLPSSELRNGRSSLARGSSKDVSFSPFPRTEPKGDSVGGGQAANGSRSVWPEPTSSPSHNGHTSGLVSLDDMMRKERMARPSTPVMIRKSSEKPLRPVHRDHESKFADCPKDELNTKAKTIEVKPLPKIRLSLMPSPREEDEEEASSRDDPRIKSKKKRSSRRSTTATPSSARKRR